MEVPESFLQLLQSVQQNAQPLLADWCQHSRLTFHSGSHAEKLMHNYFDCRLKGLGSHPF